MRASEGKCDRVTEVREKDQKRERRRSRETDKRVRKNKMRQRNNDVKEIERQRHETRKR